MECHTSLIQRGRRLEIGPGNFRRLMGAERGLLLNVAANVERRSGTGYFSGGKENVNHGPTGHIKKKGERGRSKADRKNTGGKGDASITSVGGKEKTYACAGRFANKRESHTG